jgi:hypothetical protein
MSFIPPQWDATERETVLAFNAACCHVKEVRGAIASIRFSTPLPAQILQCLRRPQRPLPTSAFDWLDSIMLPDDGLPTEEENERLLADRRAFAAFEAARCWQVFRDGTLGISSPGDPALVRFQQLLQPWLSAPSTSSQPVPWRSALELYIQRALASAPERLQSVPVVFDVKALEAVARSWARSGFDVNLLDLQQPDTSSLTFYDDGFAATAEQSFAWPEALSALRKRRLSERNARA